MNGAPGLLVYEGKGKVVYGVRVDKESNLVKT